MDRLDLDAFSNDKPVIHFNGQDIIYNEPSVEEMLELTKLTEKVDIAEKPSEFVLEVEAKVREFIPELGEQRLTIKQLNALVKFIIESSKTEEQRIREENNVEVENPKADAGL